MDDLLRQRLNTLSTQNERLKQAEGEYLLKDAGKKSMEGDVFSLMTAGSVKEREMMMYASLEYKDFMKELSQAHAKYNYERRRWDILLNAYYGELAQYKKEMDLIKKER